MNKIEIDEESELLYCSIFKQIQECGDIISSILIIYKFITENNILTEFNADKLRGIALRSEDKETSTFLWHINAVIAASSDFEHLLLGIEIMFDRFLGNKHLFIKEKEKKIKQSIISTPNQSTKPIKKSNHKFIGNEIVSFVNSYYDHNENKHDLNDKNKNIANNDNDDEDDDDLNKINDKMQRVKRMNRRNDENEDYMNKYRGKISSPISFRLRQQKRMKQSERRINSRNPSRNTSVDFNFIDFQQKQQEQEQEKLNNDNNDINDINDISMNLPSSFQPEILSPFNVSKFAKTVDLMSTDNDSNIFDVKTA